MGDPRRLRKRWAAPLKRFDLGRIEEERKILSEFGIPNRKQLRKMEGVLRVLRGRVKSIVGLPAEEQKAEGQKLINKLAELGIINSADVSIDEVLSIGIRNILERRLQTQVYKQNLANTVKQARQLILHSKIKVNGKFVTSPSYLVKKSDKIESIQAIKVGRAEKPKKEEVVQTQAVQAAATTAEAK